MAGAPSQQPRLQSQRRPITSGLNVSKCGQRGYGARSFRMWVSGGYAVGSHPGVHCLARTPSAALAIVENCPVNAPLRRRVASGGIMHAGGSKASAIFATASPSIPAFQRTRAGQFFAIVQPLDRRATPPSAARRLPRFLSRFLKMWARGKRMRGGAPVRARLRNGKVRPRRLPEHHFSPHRAKGRRAQNRAALRAGRGVNRYNFSQKTLATFWGLTIMAWGTCLHLDALCVWR